VENIACGITDIPTIPGVAGLFKGIDGEIPAISEYNYLAWHCFALAYFPYGWVC
jgi:hypothetical protein